MKIQKISILANEFLWYDEAVNQTEQFTGRGG